MGKNLSPIYEVVLFTPPKLKKNKIGCYIEYYALSPFSGKLERQRIKLNSIANRFSSKSDFRLYALSLCSELNSKLVGGWSPFGISAAENSYSLTPVKELLEKFIEDKKLSVRKDTLRSYSSFVNQLSQFIDKNVPNIRIKDFNKRIAIQMMDNYYKKGISNVSYNNFLKVARCFFSWCIEKMYIKENVFATIKPKKREQKKRTIIDKDYRNIITKYLTEKGDFYFLLVMNLIFSSLIRPKELCNLKIKHIDIENKVINIPSEIAKTHYERFSAITPEIENLIFKLNLLSYNKELYIFGTGRTIRKPPKQTTD